MSVIKFDRDFETLFNWDTDDNPTMEQDYQNAVKNWTETEMNIVDTLLWQPTTEYATGNIVKTPSLPSQYVLRCTETGTSGSTEPSYSGASVGDTVTDGTVEWVIVSLATGNAADVDASNIGVNAEVDNSEAWASAIGGGAIAEDDGRLVKGSTVHAVTSVMESNIATNTEAIEDNTEAIATNTANIEASAVKIDIDDKRISNIEKLLQGNLYDYQTDTDSKYTKTVPSGAMPYASLDSVGGKTVVWNQDVPITTNSWNKNRCSLSLVDGVYEITCTANTHVFFGAYISSSRVIAGHKYLYLCEFKVEATNTPSTFEMLYNAGVESVTSLNTWLPYRKIYTGTANAGTATNMTLRYSAVADVTVGDKVSVRNAMKIDLTLWFGAGNEPATVEEFLAMYPSYIPYNAGTLLSAGVTEVVSKGKNLADYSGGAGVPSNTTGSSATPRFFDIGKYVVGIDYINNYSASSVSVVAGENTLTVTRLSGTYYACGIPFECVGGENYTISCTAQVTGASAFVCISWYDNRGTRISGKGGIALSQTETAPSNAVVGLLTLGVNTLNIACTYSNIQVEKSATASTYSAPFAITTPIPAEIQALEGYGWSAGSVYNYVDFERKVFVKNVASVDLGTLTWIYNADWGGSSAIYSTGISAVIKKPTTRDIVANIISKYVTKSRNALYDSADGIAISTDGYVNIRDATITSGAEAKTVLNGVYLYYELATPQEIDISAYITDDNLIEVEAGGTLTFENQNGDDYRIPVPSAETYMVDLQEAI